MIVAIGVGREAARAEVSCSRAAFRHAARSRAALPCDIRWASAAICCRASSTSLRRIGPGQSNLRRRLFALRGLMPPKTRSTSGGGAPNRRRLATSGSAA